MGTYPNADAECRSKGGFPEDRGGACGTTADAQAEGPASAEQSPAQAAVLAPIQMLRARLPRSDTLHDLLIVTSAPEFLRVVETDQEIRDHVRDVAGMVSQFALFALVEPDAETLSHSHYTPELHDWLLELADKVRERTDDVDLRAAVDRLVDTFGGRSTNPLAACWTACARGLRRHPDRQSDAERTNGQLRLRRSDSWLHPLGPGIRDDETAYGSATSAPTPWRGQPRGPRAHPWARSTPTCSPAARTSPKPGMPGPWMPLSVRRK